MHPTFLDPRGVGGDPSVWTQTPPPLTVGQRPLGRGGPRPRTHGVAHPLPCVWTPECRYHYICALPGDQAGPQSRGTPPARKTCNTIASVGPGERPRPMFFFVSGLASWQSPATRRYSREFSESGIRSPVLRLSVW